MLQRNPFKVSVQGILKKVLKKEAALCASVFCG